MEIILIIINKRFIKNIFFIFYLLEFNLCYIHKINKGIKKDINYFFLKKGFFSEISEQSKLFGNVNELNYYYINLYLGKKKKKQSFLLDTGSGITSIPCKPYCNQCGQHINSYLYIDDCQIIDCKDEKCLEFESECNEKNNHCSFEAHYSENSQIKGIYFNELIQFSIGESKNKKNNNLIPIGCTIYEDNYFYTQKVDGIMGLSNSDNNFINTLYKYGMINNNIFSLCFNQKGGYMTVGEIQTKYHNDKIKFINFEKNKNFYILNINEIKINNNTISNEIYSATIDSGLTLTKMPIKIINKIIDYIKNLCELNKNNKICGENFIHQELGTCYIFNSSKELNYTINNIWPKILFSINNYEYVWKPNQYLFQFIENGKIIGCFGFLKHNANKINLGASWMIGHDIIFDNKNSRIGFAEADCNQRDMANNGEEDEEIPLYNGNINKIFKNNLGKKLFIFHIIIIIVFVIIIIIFCFCIFNLKKGKNCGFVYSRKKDFENEFINNIFNNNLDTKNDINKINDKKTSFIEMNNNY